jgi:clan AA aspartic protease (TIGR02281 family)
MVSIDPHEPKPYSWLAMRLVLKRSNHRASKLRLPVWRSQMQAAYSFGNRRWQLAGLIFPLLMVQGALAQTRGSPTDVMAANRCATANILCRDGNSLCASYRKDFESEHVLCPGVNAPATAANSAPAAIPDSSSVSRNSIYGQNNQNVANRCAAASILCRDGNSLCASYRKDFESEHFLCPGVNAPMTETARVPMPKPNNSYASDAEVNAQTPYRSKSSYAADESVFLVRENGVLKVPVRINNSITLNFILDSGASDVQIPEDVARTLIRMKAIVSGDYLGQQMYTLADGAHHRESKIRIRTLRVGNVEMANVVASVGDTRGELLLGQSFLRKLKSWSIDNDRSVLLLQERPEK